MLLQLFSAGPLHAVKVRQRVRQTAALAEPYAIPQAEVLVCGFVCHANVVSAVVKWELLQVVGASIRLAAVLVKETRSGTTNSLAAALGARALRVRLSE